MRDIQDLLLLTLTSLDWQVRPVWGNWKFENKKQLVFNNEFCCYMKPPVHPQSFIQKRSAKSVPETCKILRKWCLVLGQICVSQVQMPEFSTFICCGGLLHWNACLYQMIKASSESLILPMRTQDQYVSSLDIYDADFRPIKFYKDHCICNAWKWKLIQLLSFCDNCGDNGIAAISTEFASVWYYKSVLLSSSVHAPKWKLAPTNLRTLRWDPS